jgi:hypothetical protein
VNGHDVVTCDRAKVSDPADLSKLDAEFISNVVVQTSDGLTLKTSYLHYDQTKNTVDTKEPVEFEGRNYSGKATGMVIEAATERASLLNDVDVTIKPESEADRDKRARGATESAQQREETPEQRNARRARKLARKEKRRRAAELAQGEPEGRRQKAEGRRQRAEVRDQSQKSEVRCNRR